MRCRKLLDGESALGEKDMEGFGKAAGRPRKETTVITMSVQMLFRAALRFFCLIGWLRTFGSRKLVSRQSGLVFQISSKSHSFDVPESIGSWGGTVFSEKQP
jgi:hypothetical protein